MLDQLVKDAAAFAKFKRELCTKKSLSDRHKLIVVPNPQTHARKFKEACGRKDGQALADVLRSEIDIEGESCEIEISQWEGEFTQKDSNTWVENGYGTTCGTTVVRTLWRTAGDKNWNYREVSTIPGDVNTDSCVGGTRTTNEWLWLSTNFVDPGCKYLKL